MLEAESGTTALALARTSSVSIDALVTDVSMPGMDGLTLAVTLAEEGLVRCVVVVSGHVTGTDAIRLPGVRRWTFLKKPFGTRELLEAVLAVTREDETSSAYGVVDGPMGRGAV